MKRKINPIITQKPIWRFIMFYWGVCIAVSLFISKMASFFLATTFLTSLFIWKLRHEFVVSSESEEDKSNPFIYAVEKYKLKSKSYLLSQMLLNTGLALLILGAAFNGAAILSNDLKMPAYTERYDLGLNKSGDYFQVNHPNEVNLFFFIDRLDWGVGVASVGDVVVITSFFFLVSSLLFNAIYTIKKRKLLGRVYEEVCDSYIRSRRYQRRKNESLDR